MYKRLISLIVLTPLLAGPLQAQTVPTPTTTTTVEAYDMPGYFLVCTTSSGPVQMVEGGDQTPEGQWNIVTGLIGTDTVSFTPVALPDHYVRHRSYICYADPVTTENLYLNDGSFFPRAGLADPTAVSFESINFPNYYLTRNATFGLGIVSNPTDLGAATFKFPEQHPERAKNPVPDDEATDVPRDVVVGWTPGAYAASHNVYFGTAFDDVNSADAGSPLLVSSGQSANVYDPPGRLEFGQTYYWRIDEVNAAPDNAVFKGNVWSFTAEPITYPVAGIIATASIPAMPGSEVEKIVDGSGLTDDGGHLVAGTTMWQGNAAAGDTVWVQFEFDRLYKIIDMHVWNYNMQYEMFLNFSLKDITIEYSTDANEWTPLGDYVLAQGTGLSTCTSQAIDFGGVGVKYVRFNVNSNYGGNGYGLSEVQFNYLPVVAREPEPAAGATDVNPSAVLGWRPGREAASHEIYLSTDSNAVADGTALVDATSEASYDTRALDLMLEEKYYWMINEVNETATPSSWASDVWDFNTPAFIPVDDFESYDDEEGTRIYQTWIDGYGIGTNGSLVGHEDAPYAEEDIVISGSIQSMPFYYGTDGATTSEAELSLGTVGKDWTRAGATTLVLYVRGSLGNSPGQLYVKVNGMPVNYTGSTAALTAPVWRTWNIDLAEFGAAASSVRTLTIGVSGSGSGTLYVDDIRLYREAPPATGPAVDPGTNGLVAYYAMENNVVDGSGNGRDGTAEVGSSFEQGPLGYGRALVLDGVSGYVTLPIGTLIQSLNSATLGAWVNWTGTGTWQRVFDFGTGTSINMFLTPNSGDSTLRFAIATGAAGGGVGESIVETSPGLSEGWHYVAVTIDGTTGEMGLYLDGALVDSGPTGVLPADLGNTTQNWLGQSQWDDPLFNGSIDDFRIYNRALSAAEIQYLTGDR